VTDITECCYEKRLLITKIDFIIFC